MLLSQGKFDNPGLSHSAAHHLLAVNFLIEKHGYARVSDIARHLDITRGSVSVSMRSLKAADLVEQDSNHFYTLTESGIKLSKSLLTRHSIVEKVLTQVLGLTDEQAHRESCRVEHLLEAETTRRLAMLLRLWDERDLKASLLRQLKAECDPCQHAGVCESPAKGECPCCAFQCLDGL